MSHRDVIITQLLEVFADDGVIPPKELEDHTVLLGTGLDSLGFAILITKLAELLGFDPFLESEEPFYPVTLGELVDFYDAREG